MHVQSGKDVENEILLHCCVTKKRTCADTEHVQNRKKKIETASEEENMGCFGGEGEGLQCDLFLPIRIAGENTSYDTDVGLGVLN